MKTIITLTLLSVFLMMTPDISDAGGRDRHDRDYARDRDHSEYQQKHDRNHDGRHDRYWKKQQRHKKHDKYWKKHRKYRKVVYRTSPRRVVYRPAPTRVVYRRPSVYYPSSFLTVGVPNLNFHVSW